MGWEDYHLYLFRADGVMYGKPCVVEGMRLRSVKTTTLSEIAPAVETRFICVWLRERLAARAAGGDDPTRSTMASTQPASPESAPAHLKTVGELPGTENNWSAW